MGPIARRRKTATWARGQQRAEDLLSAGLGPSAALVQLAVSSDTQSVSLSATGQWPVATIAGVSERRYGAPGLRPATVESGTATGRLLHYRWEATHAALLRQRELPASPYDDLMLEYVNPSTGRSVLPTLGCYIQMLRPGIRTRSHRETSSAVYHVVAGAGHSVIDDRRFDWTRGDFFAVPPRARHEHAGDGDDPAILFSFQDVPLLRALGLYRMEP